ncbi:MAG: SAM-dependent methyltransferase [Actinomycetes bacterium]
MGAVGWRAATQRALYGEGGFYRRTAGPAAHFRTSVHATPLFAEAVLALARATELGTVVDVGAGRGELLLALDRLDPALRLVGVEVADRPPGLPPRLEWCAEPPPVSGALLLANEWLDDVPVDVAVATDDGPRLVLVDPGTGSESVGGELTPDDRAWLARWWPLDDAEPGARAEIGLPRDAAWAGAVGSLTHGLAVAVDYAHDRHTRPAAGSLAGYRGGRQVRPVPDGSCDVTCHVALDACAAGGARAGATATLLTDQRTALTALGLSTGLPDRGLAHRAPTDYLAGLARASQAGELVARGGLGDFGWLVQAVGVPLPQPLTGTER